MSKVTLPAGWTVESKRVTWMRTDDAGRPRISHPVQAILTDPEGHERAFDRQAEAAAYATEAVALEAQAARELEAGS